MSLIDDLKNDVANVTSAEGSVKTLLTGIYNTFKDLIATGNIAAVEQHTNEFGQNIDALTAATVANTQPQPAGVGGEVPPANDQSDTA